MVKVQSAIRKTIKAVLWAVLSFMLLFLILAALIQIPVIQTKLVQYATSFISNKTHTKVEIGNVHISFPQSVIVKGIYLEDTRADTLLYAGKTKINIALYDLFFRTITIRSFALEDATVRLYSAKTDPRFNYNFLVAAFIDTTTQAKADTLTSPAWSFNIGDVHLDNTRFSYNDEYAGMNVFAAIKEAEFCVDEIDLEKSVYCIDDLLVENLNLKVLALESANSQEDDPESRLPKIAAKNLRINNSIINYVDSVGNMSVHATIDRGELDDATIDLQSELITIGLIHFSKSKIHYHNFAPEVFSGAVVASVSPAGNNWKISVNQIKMEENSLDYRVGNKPELKNEFNADHLYFKQLSLEANDFYYDPELIRISVHKFSAIDQNNFTINSMATDFSMDKHSITTKNLKLKTPFSTIDADFSIHFTSLETFTSSYQFSNLNLNMRNVTFKSPDVFYFNQELIEQPFFKNRTNITTITGSISGAMNNLSGKSLVVKTGTNSVLETDFTIKGLPEYETAFFDFPRLKLRSGKEDIQMMGYTLIPETIEIPEHISLQLAFNGQLKSFESTARMSSSFGDAKLSAALERDEKFRGKVNLNNFDLGRLLKDTILYGPVSLAAEANGQGLDLKTINAKIKAEAAQLYLNQYNYQHLTLNGTVTGRQFEGKINLNDENAVFDLAGLVNLNTGQEQVQLRLDVQGADLQKLHFSEDDTQIALVASANIKGGFADETNGTAGITNLIIAHNGKKYVLDNFLSASVNEPIEREQNSNSALIGINYSGTVSPAKLSSVLGRFLNNYFPVSNSIQETTKTKPSKFNFEIQLHNHPILSEVLVPELEEFDPGVIQGRFDSEKNDLKLIATLNKVVYGTTEMNDFTIDVNSDSTALNYTISSGAIFNSMIRLDHFLLEGKLACNRMLSTISSTSGKSKKIQIRSQLTKENANYKLTFDPAEFYLMDNQWNIATDNYIEFGKEGFLIHRLFMNHAESQVNIASVNDRFNDDLNFAVMNFRLDDISRIVEKDSNLVKGNMDGNLLLKRVAGSYGLIADATINKLVVRDVSIGNLTVKAENPGAGQFNLDANLSGADNNLAANGFFILRDGDNSVNIKTAIQSLSMKTIEAFSMGQITEASGSLSGDILVEGNTDAPEITGQLVFNNAFVKPAFLNNRFGMKNETIQLKNDGFYFDHFTLSDDKQNTAILNGAVKMKQFSNFNFAFNITTNDFLLINTTSKDNQEFFGRMIIDSKIDVTGPMTLPVVKARFKMKKGSNFTFVVPEDQLTTDKGEDVVEFENPTVFNPILTRSDKKVKQSTGITGFDLSSIIEIDKEATLRLLMDPASSDSLVVKGEAALGFTMDRSGKMSLTGAYNLSEGSYMVSLESIIKKRFDIDAGSSIVWNGDPLDANIHINAKYTVRTSPYDLVADQISGLSDVDKGGYKQRYPFSVILKLRGEILHPEIHFEIQLSPEDKGILGGAVNQKLSLLNEDESALNKQVFALLVLGRFVQENPFQTESAGGTSTLIRSTVSKFLSAQLNQLSSKVIPGVELNFDIQSYDDYQSGQAEGRTQVEIGMKKQLFNERLSVQLGGTVDVEGDQAKQNSASDITSDVTIEYKLTKDGRFRMKGFRHNQYEGAIEGQLVETGVGVVYVRDFNRWSRLFKSRKRPPKSPEGGLENEEL